MALISLFMSCFAIILTISIHILTSVWKSSQRKYIVNYLLCLLCSYNCQIILELELYKGSRICVVLSCLKYFFRISSELWLTVLIFVTLFSIKTTATLTPPVTTAKKGTVFFRCLCVFQIVAFYYVVIVTILCNLNIKAVPGISLRHRPDMNAQFCWFDNNRIMIYYWILPRFLITQVNSILLILMTRAYYTLQKKLDANELSHGDLRDRLNKHVGQFVTTVKLFILMQIPLLCEIICEILYVFNIMNPSTTLQFRKITSHIVSLQGVYIFIIFVIVPKLPKKNFCQ